MGRPWREIRAERVARDPDLERRVAEKQQVLETAERLFEQLEKPGGWGVIYEQEQGDLWSAQIAGLPVRSLGDTRDEAKDSVAIALALYLDELERRGELLPLPSVARPDDRD